MMRDSDTRDTWVIIFILRTPVSCNHDSLVTQEPNNNVFSNRSIIKELLAGLSI